MGSSSRIAWVAAVGLAAAVLLPDAAMAQPGGRVAVQLTVLHASPNPGPEVDPDIELLDRRLRRQFRYQSLRVMQRSRLRLALREMGSVDLPAGGQLRVQPLEVEARGLLTSLAISGRLDTRVVLQRSRPIVLGAGAYEGGQLIIAVESMD